MIKRKEAAYIVLAIIVMFVVLNFSKLISLKAFPGTTELQYYLKTLICSAIIILAAVFAKKIAASSRDIEIEHKTWTLQRWWFYKKAHFRKPGQIGVILPLVLSIISLGFIKCYALLQFDARALPSKVQKRTGGPNIRTSEISEADLGVIAFWALVATLAVSLLANLLVIPLLAKSAVYYAIWNLIPFGQLDGMKILMSAGAPIHGSTSRKATKMIAPLYIFSWIITLIVLLIVLL